MKIWAFILCLLMIGAGCWNRQRISEEFPWPSSGIIAADSLLLKYEKLRIASATDALEYGKVIDEFKSLSESNPANKMLKMRLLYMKAALKLRYDHKEAYAYVNSEIKNFDSVTDPYCWHSLRTLQVSYERSIPDQYEIAADNASFFQKAGAKIDEARNLVIMANIFSQLGDAERAGNYYDKAEKIFFDHNMDWAVNIIKINRSNTAGEEERHRVLKELLNDSSFIEDRSSYSLALQNAFVSFDSIGLLDKGIHILEAENVDKGNLPMLYAMKADYLNKRGKAEDASSLIPSIRASENSLNPNALHRSLIHNILSEIYLSIGLQDSAIIELQSTVGWLDSISRLHSQSDVYSDQNARSIHLIEQAAMLQKRNLLMSWIITTLVLVFVIGILVVYAKKRRRERAYEKELLDNKIRNDRHVLLAQAKVMQESETLFSEINAVLNSLRERKLIGAEDTGEVERLMKVYKGNAESRQSFLKISRELDSSFAIRLKKDYPELSEGQLRLAALLCVGVDNRQLAVIMNNTPGAIYTSRYRLRMKLGLPKEESLEDFLRSYNRTPHHPMGD